MQSSSLKDFCHYCLMVMGSVRASPISSHLKQIVFLFNHLELRLFARQGSWHLIFLYKIFFCTDCIALEVKSGTIFPSTLICERLPKATSRRITYVKGFIQNGDCRAKSQFKCIHLVRSRTTSKAYIAVESMARSIRMNQVSKKSL